MSDTKSPAQTIIAADAFMLSKLNKNN